jgi:hypothetical protein
MQGRIRGGGGAPGAHTILRQKIIFFPIAEGGAKNVGVFRVKITILRQKILFFPILGGGGGGGALRLCATSPDF